MSIRFSEDTRHQIEVYAAERKTSLNAAVEELVTAGLNMERRSMFTNDLSRTVREAVRSEMAVIALGIEEAIGELEAAAAACANPAGDAEPADEELWW